MYYQMQDAACKEKPLTYQKGFFHYLTGFQNLHITTTNLSFIKFNVAWVPV